MAAKLRSSIHWSADSLVFAARTQSGGVEEAINVRYELQSGGRRLRAVEQIRGGGRDQDNIWIFERKGVTTMPRRPSLTTSPRFGKNPGSLTLSESEVALSETTA